MNNKIFEAFFHKYLVEIQGFKPWTSAMPWQRSNQLSYIPKTFSECFCKLEGIIVCNEALCLQDKNEYSTVFASCQQLADERTI